MSGRDLHLDFVKGVLVVAMVVYHTMNYFSTASEAAYGYIRFVSGSFIFLSGYVVSTFYGKKYQFDRVKASKRLVIRGLKILAIFTALNLLINLIGVTSYKNIHFSLGQYLDNVGDIYISGNSRFSAFQILVPISYMLVISPVSFILSRSRKLLVIITVILALSYTFLDMGYFNLYLGIIGLAGLSVGALTNLKDFYSIKNGFVIFLCFAVNIVLMAEYLDKNILTYAIGILISLKLMFDFAKTLNLEGRVWQAVILLGQYSLFCYIMQIVFLHGLSRYLKQRWGLGYETAAIFLATNIFLAGLCESLRLLRDRFVLMDRSYKLIF